MCKEQKRRTCALYHTTTTIVAAQLQSASCAIKGRTRTSYSRVEEFLAHCYVRMHQTSLYQVDRVMTPVFACVHA